MSLDALNDSSMPKNRINIKTNSDHYLVKLKQEGPQIKHIGFPGQFQTFSNQYNVLSNQFHPQCDRSKKKNANSNLSLAAKSKFKQNDMY